jgi:hypothetical protein
MNFNNVANLMANLRYCSRSNTVILTLGCTDFFILFVSCTKLWFTSYIVDDNSVLDS